MKHKISIWPFLWHAKWSIVGHICRKYSSVVKKVGLDIYVHMIIIVAINIMGKEMTTMGGYGHRNMYYATGLPGWVRFGYSPGWGGLPPAAQYMQSTGQTGQFLNWLGYPAGVPGAWPVPGLAPLPKEQQLEALNAQK